MTKPEGTSLSQRVEEKMAELANLPPETQKQMAQEARARNPGLVSLLTKMKADPSVRQVVQQAVDKATGPAHGDAQQLVQGINPGPHLSAYVLFALYIICYFVVMPLVWASLDPRIVHEISSVHDLVGYALAAFGYIEIGAILAGRFYPDPDEAEATHRFFTMMGFSWMALAFLKLWPS
jgi:hypothetical protein